MWCFQISTSKYSTRSWKWHRFYGCKTFTSCCRRKLNLCHKTIINQKMTTGIGSMTPCDPDQGLTDNGWMDSWLNYLQRNTEMRVSRPGSGITTKYKCGVLQSGELSIILCMCSAHYSLTVLIMESFISLFVKKKRKTWNCPNMEPCFYCQLCPRTENRPKVMQSSSNLVVMISLHRFVTYHSRTFSLGDFCQTHEGWHLSQVHDLLDLIMSPHY